MVGGGFRSRDRSQSRRGPAAKPLPANAVVQKVPVDPKAGPTTVANLFYKQTAVIEHLDPDLTIRGLIQIHARNATKVKPAH